MEPLNGRADRRGFLRAAGLAGMGWLTPVGRLLAEQADRVDGPARSVILIWLGGGPSQLETFDPKPGSRIAAGSRAVATAARGVLLGDGFGRLAGEMNDVSLVRSLVSKEGDHERGVYQLKTGYRPDPTVEHPSVGAVCCHGLPDDAMGIPRHVSILPGQWPARGGFLGGRFDAFQVGDPAGPLPDLNPGGEPSRRRARYAGLDVVEAAFARGRPAGSAAASHLDSVRAARTMMSSDQLRAFDVGREPRAVLADYGDNPFGRSCLAARRLIEVGVRCVEVTLDGWDSHVNNHEVHRQRVGLLDPALAALLRDLRRRELLGRTLVLCAGEFGRTPKVNLAGGRDHWPIGYSLAIAGGGVKGGRVVGETDPLGIKPPAEPTAIADVHATILTALGLDPRLENVAPATGRPIRRSEGKPLTPLLV